MIAAEAFQVDGMSVATSAPPCGLRMSIRVLSGSFSTSRSSAADGLNGTLSNL